jgi:thiosulfate/3-mercaptopyruvate sulfurtransferase
MHVRATLRLIGLIAAAALLLQSPFARAGEIVDGEYVAAAAARGATIWDVRGAKDYAAGHIPGAVSIGNAGEALRDPNKEDYLPTETVEKIFNAAGIDLGKEVIAYGDTGDPFAHWALVTIRHFGGKQGKVYHGGIDDWKGAGRPLSTEPTKLPAVSQVLSVQPDVIVRTRDVLAALNNPEVQIVDVRTVKEFKGEDIRALRGGHIPGATHIAYEKNWADPDLAAKLKAKEVKTRAGAALKPRDDLEALYRDLDPSKETIVYCQSGVRASETANVMRALGFDKVRVYEESWLGYGNTLSAPSVDTTFINVGALQGRIAKLEGAVADLTAQLEAAKKSSQ